MLDSVAGPYEDIPISDRVPEMDYEVREIFGSFAFSLRVFASQCMAEDNCVSVS